MIPLAQYFAESGSDDFTPFRPTPVRKPGAQARRPSDGSPAQPAASAVRPLKAIAVRPAVPPLRSVTEPRISLREIEAERAAWQAERARHVEALHEAAESARAAGVATGRALAREELEAENESRIDAIRLEIANDHGIQLARARVEWTEEQADRLADLLILQVAILEETIKISLNSVLRPLALDARRRQTLEDLVGAVKTIALDGMAYKIAASGPTDLLAMLEEKLGDHAQLLSFESDDTQTDIRIDADNTVIETRISSWRLALEEALS